MNREGAEETPRGPRGETSNGTQDELDWSVQIG